MSETRATTTAAHDGDAAGRIQVFHDGSCPLCRREMAFFRRRVAPEEVEFVDVSAWPPGARRHGLDAGAAMARFHVRDAGGRLHSGARAFAVLWRTTPGLRLLGAAASREPLATLLEWAYRAFLHMRPLLQRIAGRRPCHARTSGARGGATR